MARSATTPRPAVLLFIVISILVGVFVTMRTMSLSSIFAVSSVIRKRENPQMLRIATRSITTEMVNCQVERYLADVEFVHRSMRVNHLLVSAHLTGGSIPVTVMIQTTRPDPALVFARLVVTSVNPLEVMK